LALIAASVLGVALPADQAAAQTIGGRQFKLTSNGGGQVTLSWVTGTGQTGYRLNRITSAGTVVVATPAGTATSQVDTLPSTVTVACYQLEILNGTATVGRSDILCVIANVAGGPSPVRNVAIQTNESPLAVLTWQAPTVGSVIGYLVVPLGRTPLALIPAGTLQAIDAPAGPTCYIVLTLVPDSAQVPFKIGGFSDIVCAFVGTGSGSNFVNTATVTPLPLTATRTNTAVNTSTPVVVTATGTNTSTVPSATSTNTAVVGTSTSTSSPTTTLTPSNSLLTILKTDTPDPVNVGENLVYTITITNNNPGNTGPVVFQDNLPAGLTFSSAVGTQGFACFFTAQNSSVGCTATNLGTGQTATITISTTVDNPCFVISPITNVARVALGGAITATSPSFVATTVVNGCTQATSTATLTRTSTSTATITTTPLNTSTPSADLRINKFDAPDPIPANANFIAGETPVALQYTLSITNGGNVSASGVTVVDTLPNTGGVPQGNWSFGSAAGDSGFTCSYDFGFIVTCTGGTIGANGGATITIVLNVFDCAGTQYLVNNAVVDPANIIPEFNEGNNSAFSQTACGAGVNTATVLATGTVTQTRTPTSSTTPTTLPTQSASFLKTASVGNATLGQSFTYALTYSNTSGATISGIQINDTLPPTVTFLGVTADSGFTCVPIGGAAVGQPNGQLICSGGSVASGASGTITISVAVTTCTTLVNTANVLNPPMTTSSSSTTTTVSGCNTASPTVTNTPTVTLTPTNTSTATATITSTPATFDIGPITKAPAAGAAVTGSQVNYVISIPVSGGAGNVTWAAGQTSVRDTWTGFTRTGASAITFSNWVANPTCSQAGAQITCTGGSILTGTTASVTIPLIVTTCGIGVNSVDVDPDNAIAETNEANNTATATNTNICDSAITKAQNVNSVNTAGGAQNVTYTLTVNDVAPGQTNVASSTVTDTLPTGVVPQTAAVTSGSPDTGSCAIVGQTVTCTGVSGTNPVVITITAQVPITTTSGNKSNTATVTTPGDSNGANNTSTASVLSVFNYDVAVTVTDNPDPVAGAATPFQYQITIRNTSAGGFTAPLFFVNGGLMVRNPVQPDGSGTRVSDADAFATLNSVTSFSPGVTCTFPALGQGGASDNQRYSCQINPLAAGDVVTINANAVVVAAEPDGLPDVSLDATLTNTNPIPSCIGGGLTTTCAPENNFSATQTAPAATLSNNRAVRFTDID
jgi:uncharacterized repeat protein (TIGR01451 family)